MVRILLAFLLLSEFASAQITVKGRRGSVGDVAIPSGNTYTLTSAARTSAGVYAQDGTLVKTLWNNISRSAGTYTPTWDGLTDDGATAPSGSYNINVVSSNVAYEWQGVVGNNSDSMSGSTVHRNFDYITGMKVVGNYVYYTNGYNEGAHSFFKFLISDPKKRIDVMPYEGMTNQATYFIAADASKIYFAGHDAVDGSGNYFVWAINVSNDSEVTFANGVPIDTQWGRVFPSAINQRLGVDKETSGMAVQQTGIYLFVTHIDGAIRVLNKSTGALIRTITMAGARNIAVDGSDNLWITSGTNTVSKHTVNGDGTLSAATVTLSGLQEPLAIGVSPDNSTVVVADGGTSQQVKGFSNSTGSSSWTMGQAGGYRTSPEAANDKFYFSDLKTAVKGSSSSITFQPDGSFWVLDKWNNRMVKYNANRTYNTDIMSMHQTYSCAVDQTNSARVFGEYIEYEVDYTNPLKSAWTFKRNWMASLPRPWWREYGKHVFRNLITLSNGRTYALQENDSTQAWTVVELITGTGVRLTGMNLGGGIYSIHADGSFWTFNITDIGQPATWTKKTLTGFDGSNNPIWGTAITQATIPVLAATDPADWYNRPFTGFTTTSNRIVSFDMAKPNSGHSAGYHLGAIDIGGTAWKWKAANSTGTSYTGDYPTDGRFDTGNGVEHPGGNVLVQDNNIFWNYIGEFWKASQTNKWQHVDHNGLMLGQFGVVRDETDRPNAPPQMAGNAASTALTKIGNDYFIYHNDEFFHGGIHRWKVTGLNTVQNYTISITK